MCKLLCVSYMCKLLCVFLTFYVMISAPYLWIAPVCFILFYYFFKLKKS